MDEFFNKVFGSENKNIGNILAEKYRQSGQEVAALAGLRDAQSRGETITQNVTLGAALQSMYPDDPRFSNVNKNLDLLSRGSQSNVFNLGSPTSGSNLIGGYSAPSITDVASLPKTGSFGAALTTSAPTSYLDNSPFANTQKKAMYADGGQVMNPMDADYDMYRKAAAQAQVPMLDRETAIRVIAQMRANEMAAQQKQGAGAANGYADGGMVQQMPFAYADGGSVDMDGQVLQGPGTERSDSIPATIDGEAPAALSKGEMVIPQHVVQFYGTKHFDGLLEKAREAMAKAKRPKTTTAALMR